MLEDSERTAVYMRRAVDLAMQGMGDTRPNPPVGAVVVAEGEIVGEGFHAVAGGPHAEAAALVDAGDRARGATMYVTLEPCNHHGKTPPCTEAIIDAGIGRVVYAVPDPNPHVEGGGHSRLDAAGIRVEQSGHPGRAADLVRFFSHHVRSGHPYVIAKYACSLDGRIATRSGDSQWITGKEARARVHELRADVDAILIGAGTARADDPRLTARVPGRTTTDPLRVVLDSEGRVPVDIRLFSGDLAGGTVVAATRRMPEERRAELTSRGVEVWTLDADAEGRVSIDRLLDRLGSCGVQSLLVEGGARALGSFFDARRVQEVWAFLAPIIVGGREAPCSVAGSGADRLTDAVNLNGLDVERLGPDILIRGRIKLAERAGTADRPSPELHHSEG